MNRQQRRAAERSEAKATHTIRLVNGRLDALRTRVLGNLGAKMRDHQCKRYCAVFGVPKGWMFDTLNKRFERGRFRVIATYSMPEDADGFTISDEDRKMLGFDPSVTMRDLTPAEPSVHVSVSSSALITAEDIAAVAAAFVDRCGMTVVKTQGQVGTFEGAPRHTGVVHLFASPPPTTTTAG